ncbi:MAG: NAD(P)H-hydrate dehydratase [Proteobacteria bacterium]|nr:NAD(P)H-hydrate dehydratase [Pseudomonadota bacterium]HQR03292.1 NAD(P)H-hydrate dehydratase [Rhodocyclaceae bacterium]
MTAILRTDALRAIEQAHADAQPPLMERAGRAAAELAMALQAGLDAPPLIFAGPGNNGGDALVLARHLRDAGLAPVVVSRADPGRLPADAGAAWAAWRAAGGEVHADVPEGDYGLVVDGLFGLGLTRPLENIYARWVDAINRYAGPVLALDCPSGLNADTGRTTGPAIRAGHTLSFIALKPGLLTGAGPDLCGTITTADLGLGFAVATAPGGCVVTREHFAAHLLPRRRDSHKGSYGEVGILGGAPGMAGAALLAGRAALHLGGGRVYTGMLEHLICDPLQPELMLRRIEEVFTLSSVLALGPGLGESGAALDIVRRAIAAPQPLVIDADALNLLAAHPVLAGGLVRRGAATILTPHPAEAARLLGVDTASVQADRIAAALSLAQRHGAVVALKGAGTIIALNDGRWFINTSGNPGLATAGSGDVLTGMIAALLAQHWSAEAATLGAIHLHGLAADDLAARNIGPMGLTASELIGTARHLLNHWIHPAP